MPSHPAFDEGIEAHNRGNPRDANPYNLTTVSSAYWFAGWDEGERLKAHPFAKGQER